MTNIFPTSLSPALQDQYLADLAILLTQRPSTEAIFCQQEDWGDHAVRTITWLVNGLQDKSQQAATILLSATLDDELGSQLRTRLELEGNLPETRFTSVFQNTDGGLILCRQAHEKQNTVSSIPVVVVGKNSRPHSEEIRLSDYISLCPAGTHPLIELLKGQSDTSRSFRHRVRQLLAHDLTMRRANKELQRYRKSAEQAERAVHTLRIESRSLSRDLRSRNEKITSLTHILDPIRQERDVFRTKMMEESQKRAELEHHYTENRAGLESLEAFLSQPAPLWRRVLRSFRKPFIPYIPTLPELQPQWDKEDFSSSVSPASSETTDSPDTHGSSLDGIQRVLFIAGEPNTPGVAYRCTRNAEAAQNAGYEARIQPCAAVGYEDIRWADVLIFWRVEYSGHVSTILDLAQQEGVKTIFDADDIVFVPHYARVDFIDGIRSVGATEERIERCFADMRRTLVRCDQGSTTTRELALAMHELRPVVHLLPNVYDHETLRRSRLGCRLRGEPGRATSEDALIRIGYATGSRTHQRDFAIAYPALTHVLKTHPNARLVLFREKDNHRPVLLMEEFPALKAVENQIEWRDMVPLSELGEEFARFDISIAPLEVGNVFCEAKSEIKFLEASLAGNASIVSPTGPFRRIVRDNETGLLAETPEDWTRALLKLVDNPDLRRTLARNAYHDVLWPFSPEAQARRMSLALSSLNGDVEAAQAAETLLARSRLKSPALPVIPESETLFHHDILGEAEVTVIVTSYNYANHVLDALDSVAAQTLPILDLIVVDDGSTDESLDLIRIWMERHTSRFNRLIFRRSIRNAGLGGARNIGMDAAETPHTLQLDADNILRPDACETLLAAMTFGIAYAYPLIQCFDENGPLVTKKTPDLTTPPGAPVLLGDLPSNPLTLVSGNRIDAMAMVAKWAWAAAGGYYVSREAMGWEDYDLWCTFAELGLPGRQVPAILADYRQHSSSMTNASTERAAHKARVVAYVQDRHLWINLTAEKAHQRV
ncbi:GT2 family glycosyltransferase/glycosyltransferase involved in cell wall biosynthesis [Gluconobacter cerinus]|uniref:glycosyltransferase n=1 Tax=Gluconobacter cerinus TaxID=38307 RepID=UPI00222691AC|nr:GT2 family glycosyltransferase/glycosyltransferase involved in cell wall biosynthesis [Gluconobacter cerinus]